ncbi:MAG TPA: helix-hairpin-helix domain-containing protein [Planctomycetaceae bacterium]|jgi:competence protein ComEA|nr:helix-hairpin-helix domain-containing protein [Planctomycetaceae bacterium]
MGESTDTLPSSAALAPTLEKAPPPNVPPPASARATQPVALPAGEGEAVESHFWLTRGDQLIFGLLSFVALALLGVYWIRLSNWGTRTVEIERLPIRQAEFRIDANSATWVEWGQIEGIGDGLARRIVADREQNGPFRSVDDLTRVKGIGPKTLEHLRPWVRVSSESPPSEPPKRKRPRSRTRTPAKSNKPKDPAA